MPTKGPRRCNRLIVVFSSVNNVTAWSFWKFLQMKKVKGITDLCMLAFNTHEGSFEARIDSQGYSLENYKHVVGYRQDMLERFLDRWYDPGRSYLVYGGHGMGDYLELEENKLALQCHELASILGKRRFEAIVFDACFMASLECAYQLRHNTRYIGASEGYVWVPDTSLDHHVLNAHTASEMSRFKDPKSILLAIQRDYCSKTPLADFAVIDTTHVEALRKYVEDHVMQRVYDRATFYNTQQQQRLCSIAEGVLRSALHEGGSDDMRPIMPASSSPMSSSQSQSALSSIEAQLSENKVQKKRELRRLQLQRAVQFEHALYPSEVEDKYILDLKSYLIDIAREEEWAAIRSHSGKGAHESTLDPGLSRVVGGFITPPAVSPPRTSVVENHGSLPRGMGYNDAQYARGSGHKGLELFRRVVISHKPPQNASVYASHLGGLSIPVFEFSKLSKPLKPWEGVKKGKFQQKAREFMRKGVMQDVQMSKLCTSSHDIPASPLCSYGSSISLPPGTADDIPLVAAVARAPSRPAATAAPLPGERIADLRVRSPFQEELIHW